MIFCNIRTDFNTKFCQFSVARKLILNGGAIRPIGLLFSSCATWQRSFSNADLSVGVVVFGGVNFKGGGGGKGQSQKRFSNFFSFLA